MRTNWNPKFDNRPTSDVPRIRFSQKFSAKYLENRNLILEVGCGTGSYTRLTDRKGYFGLDLDIEAIKIAKKYCINSDFVVASALNLPFRDEIFDLICIWGVFEEIPVRAEKQILDQVHKTLSPKAALLLSIYNDHIVSKILDPAFLVRGVRHYNLKEFISLVSGTGFIVNEYTIRGGLNTIIDIFLFYFNKHILKKRDSKIKNFFEEKSNHEFNSSKSGIVYTFIAAHKK
jgi:SAM-dependent methyltransferase